MGFLATDGDDAETNVAGGIVTGATITSDNIQAAHDALDRNDTFTFLDGVGSAWGNGPTGTNVNDLVIGIVG
jgi:hydroxypyruvate reductase